jgi:hypothetical protein
MNLKLMLEVRRRVLAEPETVNMNHFVRHLDCLTSCCIAGHTVVAAKGMAFLDGLDKTQDPVDIVAARLLGITTREADYLFYFHETEPMGRGPSPYSDLRLKLERTGYGTVEYAQVVAQAIDRCIIRNTSTPPLSISAVQTTNLIEASEELIHDKV